MCSSSWASPSRHNLFSETATMPYSSSAGESSFHVLCSNPWQIKQDSSSQSAIGGVVQSPLIFDPNPWRAEKQLLSCSAMKTVSALIDSASVHKNKLARGHNLATFHRSLWCRKHQASTGSFHLRWLLLTPQPQMIRRGVWAQNSNSLRG